MQSGITDDKLVTRADHRLPCYRHQLAPQPRVSGSPRLAFIVSVSRVARFQAVRLIFEMPARVNDDFLRHPIFFRQLFQPRQPQARHFQTRVGSLMFLSDIFREVPGMNQGRHPSANPV